MQYITDAELKTLAKQQLDWAINIRRELHMIPEPGFKEEKTRAYICKALDEIGVPYEHTRGWIVAYIEGGEPGIVTGLRADIDALPVTEPEGRAFRSRHEGWMHACGHDMHAAILLGAARLLARARGRFRGGAKLFFQPAEESVGGAKPMTEAGVMDNPRVGRVYGLHVMPRLTTGQVECRPGTLNASTDDVRVTIYGRASHGAYPENGSDAIVCAAQLITALQTIISRNISPLDSAVLSLGKIEGGRASNIICDKVTLAGTLRTASAPLRESIIKRANDIARGVSSAMGCEADISVIPGYAALVNDDKHAERVLDIASKLLGAQNALVKDAPSMGGEDFSYFLERAPGAFYHIGCSASAQHACAPLHSERFDPDEACMEQGILMQAALVALD